MQATDVYRANAYQEWFYFFTPLLVGGLLLASAGLKSDQLLVDEATQGGLLGSRWFLIALVECELLLGMWLLSGAFPYRCRQVVLAVFSVFAIVALKKALSGESSCGCFGRFEVNPWWTLGLDIFVLGAIWKWRTFQSKRLAPDASCEIVASPKEGNRVRTFAVAGVVLLVGVPISIQMLSAHHATLTRDGAIEGDDELVILEPEEWIDQPLPIAAHIDIGEQLLKGPWILVLFHHDCPKCQEALPQYEQLAQEGSRKRIAIVEVPPYGEKASHAAASIYGRLTDGREWFVQAPVEIVVENGIVKCASTELPSLGDVGSRSDGVFSAAVP